MNHENKKRALSESEKELDDSIASIRTELISGGDISLKDLGLLMVRLIDRTESTRTIADDANERARLAETKCDQLHRRATDIETTSAHHQNEIDSIKHKVDENEVSLRKMEQHKIDNDIFLSGFPIKPDHKRVTRAISKLYDIPVEMVDHSYQYQFVTKKTPEPGPSANSTIKKVATTQHHVVISFKEREAKFTLMRTKREKKGQLFFEQLDNSSSDENVKKTVIRIAHRLTRFNLAVQSRLLKAKNDQKIEVFQLHNGVFRYKEKEGSEWNVIGSESALNSLLK